MSNPYSTLKPAWHWQHIEGLREGKAVAPINIQLILSDYCNQSCEWCAYRAPSGLSSELFWEGEERNPKRMISDEKGAEIIADAAAAGVKSITFTGGGEPTVHPTHLSLFNLANYFGMDTSLNTNGVILREGWEEAYSKMAYIRVSIDAGSELDYALTRGVSRGVYGKVLDNTSKIVDACPNTTVGTGFVVSPANYEGLVDGVENIRATGAAYCRLAFLQSTDGMKAYGNEWLKVKEAVVKAQKLETDSFKVINLMDSNMGTTMDKPQCWFQELVYYIGADLNMYRCCYTAYTELGKIGSLKNMRLSEWLQQPPHRFRYFVATRCGNCPLYHKNEVIHQLVQEVPQHVNFI